MKRFKVLPRLVRCVSALTIVSALASASSGGQQLQVRELPKPTREIDDPFSLVGAAIEIRGGQLIVTDGAEQQLFVVDFAKGTRTVLGRQGSGPGEYRAPAGLFRLQGDTIWVLDAAQMRIAAFSPDLKPGTAFPFLLFDQQSSMALSGPYFADSRGRVYGSAMPIKTAQSGSGAKLQIPDTIGVVRVDARDKDKGSRTEITRVRIRSTGTPEMQRSGNTLKYTMAFPGLVASDVWTVFPDGRVAIVRGGPYTVEFIAADGKKSTPVAVPYERFKVTDDDKKAELEAAKREMGDQQKAVQKMMPANFSMTFELTAPDKWPNEYPAVGGFASIPAADGKLWVKRAIPVRRGREQWDVIDRSGKLVARWQLPPKVTVVAAGDGVVYTVRTDDDDLRYIQKISLPK
ncbi:MAG: 6-bladed beta-propeller [Gemmatimonadaceae bacterium]